MRFRNFHVHSPPNLQAIFLNFLPSMESLLLGRGSTSKASYGHCLNGCFRHRSLTQLTRQTRNSPARTELGAWLVARPSFR